MLLLCVAAATLASTPARGAPVAGSWTARLETARPGQLYLSLEMDSGDSHGSNFDRSAFTGLAPESIASKTRVPVRFTLVREAGTLTFEGTFHDGRGAGDFAFAANRDFVKQLEALDVPFEPKHGDTERELLHLALFDVSTPFIRSMQSLGYREPLDRYVEFRIFGVDSAYVRDMASLGFDHLSAAKLTETRIHGATPEYIRKMRASGVDLTLEKYIEMRIFNVTPEFAQEMAHAGYPDLSRDVLVQFRIHGVDPDFVRELRDLGYTGIPAQKLVEMRIFGVTPSFIRRAQKAGGGRPAVDKLIQMRIMGVDPEAARAVDDGVR
jgi:hypothetical protein